MDIGAILVVTTTNIIALGTHTNRNM